MCSRVTSLYNAARSKGGGLLLTLSRRIGGTFWVVGGSLLVVAVFALAFYVAMKIEMRSSEVSVPDLAGLTREEAARQASPLHLVLDVVAERHDPAVSSGRILQQEPPPGASVRRGRKIKIVLSLGGEVLEIPDLVGQGARTVAIDLKRGGLAPGSEAHVFSGDRPAGTVLAQVPPPGSPAVPGTRVHRLVTDGPLGPKWVMPDLTGRPRAAVEKWIDLCGFRRGPTRLISSTDRPPGTVVGHLPLAGYPVSGRAVVELTVAR